MEPKVDSKANSVSVVLDESVYPRSVGLAAAYHFLDRCYVRLERRPQRRLEIRLKGKEPLAGAGLRGLGEEFGNELVHQLMRHQVSERTEQLRAVLVGRAMLSAEPVQAEGAAAPDEPWSSLDYLEDPLGIAVPWEEKREEPSKPSRPRGKTKRR